jgi:hypothetical protein
VNGELFVQGRPIYLGEPRLYTVYSIDKKQLSMSADNHLMDMSLTFYYFIDSVNTNYKIEDFFHNGQLNVTLLYDVNFAVFSCNNNHYFNCINSRDLVITKLDTENKIVSGRFNFILISETDITDTIKITDGRFDSKLHLNQ